MQAVDWFTYRPQVPLNLSIPASPAEARNALDDLAEEIVVIGERQQRDFMRIRPNPELTGPRALDVAQPVVPGPGAVCSYKTLCYDMSQPPLRADLARLFGD